MQHGGATLEEVTGDELNKDIGPGDMTEHSQAEGCFRLNPWASHIMETAPGEDATVASIVGASIDVTNSNENFTCINGHTQSQATCYQASQEGNGNTLGTGVLGERILTNMIRWDTNTMEDVTSTMLPQQGTHTQPLSSHSDPRMSHFDIEFWRALWQGV